MRRQASRQRQSWRGDSGRWGHPKLCRGCKFRALLNALRTRAPFALAVLLADLAIYDLVQLVFFLRAHRFPDFLLFWAAARTAALHGPGAVYSAASFDAAVTATWGSGPPWPYLNPPVLAWLLVPLTLMPFGVAFAIWLATSAAALGYAAWLSGQGWLGVLSAAGFLPSFVALGSGQVAPLALLAIAGAVRADRGGRWLLAGGLLGVLAVKPQLGVLLPVALLASGRWRPVAVLGVIAVVVAAVTLVIVGPAGVRSWLSALAAFSDNPYFLRWSLVPVVGDAGWWAVLGAGAAVVAAAARRWRDDAASVYGIGLVGSILVNHYLTPSDLVMLLLPVWALAAAGGRAATLAGLLWAAGWLALFFPPLLIAAEVATLAAVAQPVIRVAPARTLAPAT